MASHPRGSSNIPSCVILWKPGYALAEWVTCALCVTFLTTGGGLLRDKLLCQLENDADLREIAHRLCYRILAYIVHA